MRYKNFQEKIFLMLCKSVTYLIATPPLIFGKETPPSQVERQIELWELY